MRKQTRLQFKAGLFINIGLVLFAVAVLALGSSHGLLTSTNTYFITSPSAQGLLQGARVLLAGVPVGTVSSFELRPEAPPVRIGLSIDAKYANLIRLGMSAEITTEGLVGERIISLTPGNARKPVIQPGHEIAFKGGTSLDRMLGKAEALMGRFDRILGKVDHGSGTISAFLNDPELYDNVKSLVGEANENRIVRNLVRKAIKDSDQKRVPASKSGQGDPK